MINKQELKNFELKNFKLKSGTTIDLDLKYLAFGNLNEDKSNVILYPTRYAGTHLEQGNITVSYTHLTLPTTTSV